MRIKKNFNNRTLLLVLGTLFATDGGAAGLMNTSDTLLGSGGKFTTSNAGDRKDGLVLDTQHRYTFPSGKNFFNADTVEIMKIGPLFEIFNSMSRGRKAKTHDPLGMEQSSRLGKNRKPSIGLGIDILNFADSNSFMNFNLGFEGKYVFKSNHRVKPTSKKHNISNQMGQRILEYFKNSGKSRRKKGHFMGVIGTNVNFAMPNGVKLNINLNYRGIHIPKRNILGSVGFSYSN
jgi:hypothetical protein